VPAERVESRGARVVEKLFVAGSASIKGVVVVERRSIGIRSSRVRNSNSDRGLGTTMLT
jgi:hypothetical protein